MTKTELLNQLARSDEERLLLARAMDKLDITRRKNIPAHTGFLSPAERTNVEKLIASTGHPRHLFFGGFEGAERTICIFLPDWQEAEDFLLLPEESPLCALRCTFSADAALTHRDFLGSILGHGITREKVGDLLVREGSCDLILLREIADFLLLNLDSAGRTRLKLHSLPLSELSAPEVNIRIIRDTVATPRLDAVAAAAFSTSRGKASDLISGGRVMLNYQECTKSDRTVAQGDVISCRGLGKCVVKKLGGLSKKGRILLELERYL